MISKRIYITITIFSMTISAAYAQEPTSLNNSISDRAKQLLLPRKVETIEEVGSQAGKLIYANFFAATFSFCYGADRLGLGTHSRPKNMKILGSLVSGVGLASYGMHQLIGSYLYQYQLKDNKNFKLPDAIEQRAQEIIRQRVPEYQSSLPKTVFIGGTAADDSNFYAVASTIKLFKTEPFNFKMVGLSSQMIQSIQTSLDGDNSISTRDMFALVHETGHLMQSQADHELKQAIQDGWLPFLSDEHKKVEVAADLFAINRFTAPELLVDNLTGRMGEVHSNGYLTNDQLNFIMKKRHGSLENNNKL
jgi:hypothetical protein